MGGMFGGDDDDYGCEDDEPVMRGAPVKRSAPAMSAPKRSRAAPAMGGRGGRGGGGGGAMMAPGRGAAMMS